LGWLKAIKGPTRWFHRNFDNRSLPWIGTYTSTNRGVVELESWAQNIHLLMDWSSHASMFHVWECFCFVVLRLVHPMLPISLDYSILIAPSVFSNVYFTMSKVIVLFFPYTSTNRGVVELESWAQNIHLLMNWRSHARVFHVWVEH
jgi:hypothetical protein